KKDKQTIGIRESIHVAIDELKKQTKPTKPKTKTKSDIQLKYTAPKKTIQVRYGYEGLDDSSDDDFRDEEKDVVHSGIPSPIQTQIINKEITTALPELDSLRKEEVQVGILN